MPDPRLCSMHLETEPRREDFRRAREALLGGCGQQTLAISPEQLEELNAQLTQNSEAQLQSAAKTYWIRGSDGIHSLKTGLNTIGRLPDNDVPVSDGSVSRRHCAIVVHVTRGCEVYDTASKNGTFVNGHRIVGPTALKVGDYIRVCDRQFVFGAGDAPPSDDPNGRTYVDV